MGKLKNEAIAIEQTIREKVVEALAASGLNVQLKHAENIAARIETIVEQHVNAALTAAGIKPVETVVSDEGGNGVEA